MSIKDRIAKIQENSLKWQEKVFKDDPNGTLNETPKLNELRSSLLISQETWRLRVDKTDGVNGSPLRRTSSHVSSEGKPNSLTLEDAITFPHRSIPIAIPRSTSKENRPEFERARKKSNAQLPKSAIANIITTQIVPVPSVQEDALKDFFHSEPLEETNDPVDVQLESVIAQPNSHLDDNYHKIAMARRVVRPERRKPMRSTNHLKLLAERTDLRTEYEEVRCVSALQSKRPAPRDFGLLRGIDPSDRISEEMDRKHFSMTTEAMAALGAQEDFTSAKSKLRQAPGNIVHSLSDLQRQLLPYKHPMLLHIKGRKQVQVRLVQARSESLSSDDCFILVTANRVFAWFGIGANVIEVNKARELASWIVKHMDLGFRRTEGTDYVSLQEKSLTDVNGEKNTKVSNLEEFWSLLGCEEPRRVDPLADAPEDELFEVLLNHTNRVYEVTLDELVPFQEYWGRAMKYEMLRPDKAFVFDFGSEVYLWTGKLITPELRAAGIELVQQAYQGPCDYSPCRISPLNPMGAYDDLPSKCESRPEWTLLARVIAGGETILFKQKFIDWPDLSQLNIGLNTPSRQNSASKTHESAFASIKPYSADELYDVAFNQPPPMPELLTLEGRYIGRGGDGSRFEDGIMRRYRVETDTLTVWHVSEFNRTVLPSTSLGQFHQGDTYVVRWGFRVLNVGMRDIPRARGSEKEKVKHAYFFWQGSCSKVTEKGASALMAVELDEERGPQIRVPEGEEPPAFCRLFNGRMVIHGAKRHGQQQSPGGADEAKPYVRLFLVRGESPVEGFLLEVPPQLSSLRSQGVFLVLQYAQHATEGNTTVQKAWLWAGRSVSESSLKIGRFVIDQLQAECPKELAGGLPTVYQVVQMEDQIGPGEMVFLLNGRSPSSESLCVDHSSESTPFVVWEISYGSDQQMNLRRLHYPLHPDGDTESFSISQQKITTADFQRSPAEKDNPLEMAKLMASRLQTSVAAATQAKKNKDQRLVLPFFLRELYKASQPAIFLIISGTEAVYVWQGYFPNRRSFTSQRSSLCSFNSSSSMGYQANSPEGVFMDVASSLTSSLLSPSDAMELNQLTGSIKGRFYALRKATLMTADSLARKIGAEAFLVYAGLEPPKFLALFPPHETDTEIRTSFQPEDGKVNHQADSVGDILSSLDSSTYSLADLQQKRFPDDLNGASLERYLSSEEFQKTFKMTREEFDQLPSWKRLDMKKLHKLY